MIPYDICRMHDMIHVLAMIWYDIHVLLFNQKLGCQIRMYVIYGLWNLDVLLLHNYKWYICFGITVYAACLYKKNRKRTFYLNKVVCDQQSCMWSQSWLVVLSVVKFLLKDELNCMCTFICIDNISQSISKQTYVILDSLKLRTIKGKSCAWPLYFSSMK